MKAYPAVNSSIYNNNCPDKICPGLQQWHECYGVTNCFVIYLRPTPREEMHVQCCKSDQGPMSEKFIMSKTTTILLLNEHSIKMVFKDIDIYPQNSAALGSH